MELLYKKEVFTIIGRCMEVWGQLGFGFSEVIYKDAMEIEFSDYKIPFSREPELNVFYKGHLLKHRFFSDFIVFDKIIVEVKCGEAGMIPKNYEQTLNYLKASGFKLSLLINFGKKGVEFKRIVL